MCMSVFNTGGKPSEWHVDGSLTAFLSPFISVRYQGTEVDEYIEARITLH